MIERNAGLPPERRIEFRVGVHLGDVVEESDGDLMGDGVNIAARLEGIAKPGAICLSEDAYRQVSGRLDMAVIDLGPTQLKNIERSIRVYSLQVGVPAQAKPATEPKAPDKPPTPKPRWALMPLIAGIVALVVIAGGAWYFVAGNRTAPIVTTPPPAEAAHLSIVVLPFTNGGAVSTFVQGSAAAFARPFGLGPLCRGWWRINSSRGRRRNLRRNRGGSGLQSRRSLHSRRWCIGRLRGGWR